MQHGIIFDGIVGIPKYLCEQILRLELPPMTTLSIRTHIYELEFFNATLKEYENIYKDGPVDEVLRKTYIFLLSVPGIGPLAATALTYEIGDWNRFPNEKAIAAFVGLTPCEFSSGEHNHKGPITGQGNQWLRSLLIEASWRLISKDPEMYSFYERLKIKKGSKKAIVAVARKLICRLYAMVKKEEVYKFKKAA